MAKEKTFPGQFSGWEVEPDPNRYGAFVIPEIEHAQRHTASAEEAERLETTAASLLQAAPELHEACKQALEWFRKARRGTLDQLEEALGTDAPVDVLDRALRMATNETTAQKKEGRRPVRHVCADCGKAFPREKPLQPVERFWQRVEAGEVVPSGQCPDCGALCYLERGRAS